MTITTDAATTVASYTVWELASKADCYTPDADSSPGAMLLRNVQDSVLDSHSHEPFGTYGDYDDVVRELADDAASPYTTILWTQFVDLGAYTEDISELVTDLPDSLDTIAAVALSEIAHRLASTLADELAEDVISE